DPRTAGPYRHHIQGRGLLSQPWRSLVGYRLTSGPPAVNPLSCDCGIRAGANTGTNRGGSHSCSSRRCQVRPPAQAFRISATRSDQTPGQWRNADFYRPIIRRGYQHDIPAELTCRPHPRPHIYPCPGAYAPGPGTPPNAITFGPATWRHVALLPSASAL